MVGPRSLYISNVETKDRNLHSLFSSIKHKVAEARLEPIMSKLDVKVGLTSLTYIAFHRPPRSQLLSHPTDCCEGLSLTQMARAFLWH